MEDVDDVEGSDDGYETLLRAARSTQTYFGLAEEPSPGTSAASRLLPSIQ